MVKTTPRGHKKDPDNPPPFPWPPHQSGGGGGSGDLWVFGYGSLMWQPGFDHLEARPARLYGYHRAFCMLSWHYRGTRDNPGLVLGLDAGGSCLGRAFRIAPPDTQRVRRYLWDREMITGMYDEKLHPIYLPGSGRPLQVTALTYVVDRHHEQYAGKLSLAQQAAHIAGASGRRGPNRDYLANTIAYLDELGIADGALHRLNDMVNG